MGFLMGHSAWQIDQFPTCWPMNGLFVHWSRGWGVSSFSERLVPVTFSLFFCTFYPLTLCSFFLVTFFPVESQVYNTIMSQDNTDFRDKFMKICIRMGLLYTPATNECWKVWQTDLHSCVLIRNSQTLRDGGWAMAGSHYTIGIFMMKTHCFQNYIFESSEQGSVVYMNELLQKTHIVSEKSV